ncbi:hypothetical protein QBC45DRAFT_304494, partial [Copromyces sp. CBS 386.78]
IDRDSKRPLPFQAVELIQKALEAGAAHHILLEEQRKLRDSSPPNSILWLFHSVV